ncbi:MAG: Hpt domain-containing protein [Magnetococcales bacterium]|nr:Hpt domain-containing protein [Magnetococcales bacterium]
MSAETGPIVVHPDPDLEDIIPGYLDNRRNELPALKTALADNDFETLKILGHRMKGSGAGYGFDGITDIGFIIEMGARDENSEAIASGIEQLLSYLERVEVVYE